VRSQGPVKHDEWIPEATRVAMARILDHAGKVGLANTEEFTFRSFFMAAAYELLDKPRFQTEWGKFDLLVQSDDGTALIEFKYYLLRRTYRIDGTPGPRKGGAGTKNETEFHACIDKLRNTVIDGIDQRRLILVYERDGRLTGRRCRSLHGSYGQLAPSTSLTRVWSLTHGPLEARVLEPAPTT
jgi:hypothetical protein